jgi:hypothetical protein
MHWFKEHTVSPILKAHNTNEYYSRLKCFEEIKDKLILEKEGDYESELSKQKVKEIDKNIKIRNTYKEFAEDEYKDVTTKNTDEDYFV